ncbi:Fimbrillin-like [Prevotella communis]|uniref:Fimbrillin-like n=1 Tax=Prevotella communis TaxID=2913614 RepID=A0A1G7T273_9BACT|nr:fimbrillin family protein [Prevotella communis]SDG29134.1 Fimbrillin-like [Prevotella communis]
MMKKVTIFAAIAMTMVGCSSDELVNNSTENNEAPIAFSVEKKNISRAVQNLESLGHYNFGVWAYKYGTSLTTQKVMDNYLVGYSDGKGKGYSNANVTTWAETIGTQDDHKSPWFYEYLGTAEYQNTDATKGYLATQSAYMSANANQYLRYWDLAYTTTNFYAYAPYRSAGVTFDETTKKVTVAHGAQTAGYDDASLNEFMYAGATATNADKKDVKLTFKHLGAQVNLRFYENVRGYRVEIIDVTSSDNGIQATPATKSGDTYTTAKYYTTCGATIEYTSSTTNPTASVTNPIATVNHDGATKVDDNLVFVIPAGTTDGLTTITAPVTGKTYDVIPEDIENPTTQTYAKSSTVYYPVAQPTDSEVGFTFHVSYKLIAEDNGEEITVNDARVYVPAKSGSEFIAAWQPNTKYTYTFKITKDSTGSTDPNTPDVDDPTVPPTPQVYPIVFDGATVEDYTEKSNDSNF